MDFKNPKAIYLQIADWVCDQILSGKYREGDKLPAIRECATELEVNINTVARTCEWLQLHDIVTAKRGMGNYVAIGAMENIATMKREEFFKEQLPELFNTMKALGIQFEEIERRYKAHLYAGTGIKGIDTRKNIVPLHSNNDSQKDDL